MAQPFDPRHPSALAIYCSDGRFTVAVEDLLEGHGQERFDTMTLPGGPALLAGWPADLSEVHVFSRATQFLIEGHAIANVVLIAHEGCGFYRARAGRLSDVEVRRLQIDHLNASRATLLRQHPTLTIVCYYASVTEGAIEFTEVTR